MQIAINDMILPIKGDLSDAMTGKEFFDFCQQNDVWRIERDENKQIIIMAPTNANTGKQNLKLCFFLELWNNKKRTGICFDSSTGFTLPDGSVRSPDASWLAIEKWNALSNNQKNQFAHICPDFVIELKSNADNLKSLTSKMHKWIKNGCALAWLIDLENKTVLIFRKNGTIEKIEGFENSLSGEDILPGFELELKVLND